MRNGLGVNESIVHASKSSSNAYWYRSGLGMFGSLEFQAFMDDFVGPVATNVPNGWAAAIIDAGATTTTYTTAGTGANGVLQLLDANASEGSAFYGAKSLQLTSGKRFFMEMRFQTDDVTDNAVQFGLTDLTAVVNPEDLWTTTAANVVAWGLWMALQHLKCCPTTPTVALLLKPEHSPLRLRRGLRLASLGWRKRSVRVCQRHSGVEVVTSCGYHDS